MKAIDGLYKLKKWIEDRGLKRAAVTNAPRPNAELMISLLGLTDFFEAVIVGSDCERAKPFPDPYLKALEVLKVSKDHTIIFEVKMSFMSSYFQQKTCTTILYGDYDFFCFVQDSVSGIKAGVAAEIPVIGLTTRNPAQLLMEAKPTFLIKDYEDPKLWTALEELDKSAGRLADSV